MPHIHPKAVAWLVPSDAILRQTVRTLSDREHPYRQVIDAAFSGKTEIYTKDQLLAGQNFNPTSVNDNLSIFVLTYDSFRTSKKEGRKAYQQNGQLMLFSQYFEDRQAFLPDMDETALIQVIRSLNPVVVVDESHHAVSKLSVEMLENFNPCFVLELTATPKQESNIISIVDARKLKKEEMVKLPVIVYNQKNQEDVFLSAIALRRRLEAEAVKAEEEGGQYIRPIVLFQAQPRVSGDATTYEKIKQALLDMGIPTEHIAIKTGEKDEIKDTDLLSRDCPIRYIITVNALKEGWDCPFAYVLATVANRTSVVDVEQILGRIFRMPYAKAGKKEHLNLSYALTSSSDFYGTLDKVVAGLHNAGFTKRDHRVASMVEEPVTEEPGIEYEAKTFHMWMEQDRIVCEPNYHFKEKITPARSISSIPKSLYEEEDGDLNDYEREVIWELSGLENIRWWHRNTAKRGFAINGAVTAYPDLIVRTESGRTLMIETKGDHLENDESRAKAKAGAEWASMAGRMYRYFMVFQTKDPGYSGAYSYERFRDIVQGL